MVSVVKLFMGIIVFSLMVVVIFMGIVAAYLSNFKNDDYNDEEDFIKEIN